MAKLKLGPLPDDKPVKRTVVLPAELDALLTSYAEALSAEHGQTVPVEKLIPPILDRFLRTDRAFMKARRQLTGERTDARPITQQPTSGSSSTE